MFISNLAEGSVQRGHLTAAEWCFVIILPPCAGENE